MDGRTIDKVLARRVPDRLVQLQNEATPES